MSILMAIGGWCCGAVMFALLVVALRRREADREGTIRMLHEKPSFPRKKTERCGYYDRSMWVGQVGGHTFSGQWNYIGDCVWFFVQTGAIRAIQLDDASEAVRDVAND